jgi:hypothetical protein
MENYGEVAVSDFVRLMRDYLEGRTDVQFYRQTYFALMKKRMNLSEDESRILQHAYGDADDYDQKVRLPFTLEESELKKRVAKSLQELAGMGYADHPERPA